MFGKIIDKFKSKPKAAKEGGVMDPRLVRKILESDLWEYLENMVNVSGYKGDKFFGMKYPDKKEDPLNFFFLQLSHVNTGIISRPAFERQGFSEAEINAIFGNAETTFGSTPQRFVKDRVWQFMCNKEWAKVAHKVGSHKEALSLGKSLADMINSDNYIDWGKAIREFWKDESTKNYSSYIVIKQS